MPSPAHSLMHEQLRQTSFESLAILISRTYVKKLTTEENIVGFWNTILIPPMALIMKCVKKISWRRSKYFTNTWIGCKQNFTLGLKFFNKGQSILLFMKNTLEMIIFFIPLKKICYWVKATRHLQEFGAGLYIMVILWI